MLVKFSQKHESKKKEDANLYLGAKRKEVIYKFLKIRTCASFPNLIAMATKVAASEHVFSP